MKNTKSANRMWEYISSDMSAAVWALQRQHKISESYDSMSGMAWHYFHETRGMLYLMHNLGYISIDEKEAIMDGVRGMYFSYRCDTTLRV
jgi:hypothetical protein